MSYAQQNGKLIANGKSSGLAEHLNPLAENDLVHANADTVKDRILNALDAAGKKQLGIKNRKVLQDNTLDADLKEEIQNILIDEGKRQLIERTIHSVLMILRDREGISYKLTKQDINMIYEDAKS